MCALLSSLLFTGKPWISAQQILMELGAAQKPRPKVDESENFYVSGVAIENKKNAA